MRAWLVRCALCLPLLTTSCATPPAVEYRVVTPPRHLLAECPVPAWVGGDWAQVIDLAVARGAALDQCNADKAAIRAAVEQAEATYRTTDSPE